MNHFARFAGFLLVALCGFVSVAHAQVPVTKANTADEAEDKVDTLGSHLAVKMMLMNKEAIVLGELAERQAQSPTIKKFAQESVAEHKQLEKALQPLIDPVHLKSIKSIDTIVRYSRGEPGTWQERADAERIRDNKWVLQDEPYRKPPEAQLTSTPEKAQPSPGEIDQEVDVIQYKCEAVKDHIQAVVKKLESYEKSQFDLAYLQQVIRLHGWMIAELGAMKATSNAELTKLVHETKQQADQHLAQARKLADQLEGYQP